MTFRAWILGLGAVALLGGCGGIIDSIFGSGGDDSPTGDPPPGLFAGADAGADGHPCVNLCTKQVACQGGTTTSLSGTVRDPAGKVPLYNVLVFVPNAPVAPLTSGATCDRCGSVSGDPLVSTITDVNGHFQLDNVPVGSDIPLVVQVGKWRRQLTIPTVAQCVDTKLDDAQIRLPKNKSEGDIPQIALTTGGADVMECWLRKVGLDDAEFTTSAGDGRVHFFTGSGNKSAGAATSSFKGGAAFPNATALWSDQASLSKYDIVILSCEGDTFPATKPQAAIQALHDYAGIGGRVFASHWHRYWFNTAAEVQPGPPVVQIFPGGAPSAFETFGSWQDSDDPQPSPGCSVNGKNCTFGTIQTGFPKGQAMHDWLANTGSLQDDKLPIMESRDNITAVEPAKATQWISLANGHNVVEYLSFNTPIPAPDEQKCGRVVYSDVHVSSGDQPGQPWPSGCQTKDLSPQEKALEFMLFDLSSCIQNDNLPPAPPPTVK
jgi:hypothetical protein